MEAEEHGRGVQRGEGQGPAVVGIVRGGRVGCARVGEAVEIEDLFYFYVYTYVWMRMDWRGGWGAHAYTKTYPVGPPEEVVLAQGGPLLGPLEV